MHGLQSGCYTGAGVPAGVHDVLVIMMFRLVEQGLNAWLGERPSASVKRLFLAPNNCFRVRVHIEVLLQLLPWEGVQLLNTSDGRVGVFIVGAMLVQCDIYLAGTKDDAVDVLRVSNGITVFWVRDDPSEMGVAGKLFNGGATEWMSKKRFREEEDKG